MKDLNNAALDEDSDLTEDQEKIENYIDETFDSEKLEALEQVLTEGDDIEKELMSQISPSSTQTKDEEKTQAEVKEEKSETVTKAEEKKDEKPIDESAKTDESGKAAEEPAKAPEKPKVFEITDEYIEKAPEEDRNLLKFLKGETMSEKSIKVYLDGQRQIGKLSSEIGQLKKTTEQLKETTETTPQSMTEELEKVKETLVAQELIKKYPQLLKEDGTIIPFDTRDEEFKEFLRDLNADIPGLGVQEFIELKKSLEQKVGNEVKQAVHIRNNHKEINKDTLSKDVESIKDRLQNVFGVAPKDLGLDIEPTRDEKGALTNAYLLKLLTDESGQKTDDNLYNIVGTKEPIALLKKGSIAQKFFELNMPQIIQVIRDNSVKKGYVESQEKKKEVNPTLSSSNAGSRGVRPLSVDAIIASNDTKAINAMIAEMEKVNT